MENIFEQKSNIIASMNMSIEEYNNDPIVHYVVNELLHTHDPYRILGQIIRDYNQIISEYRELINKLSPRHIIKPENL